MTVQAVLNVLAEEYEINIQNLEEDIQVEDNSDNGIPLWLWIILIFLVILIFSVGSDSSSSSHGGFFGGSSGGFPVVDSAEAFLEAVVPHDNKIKDS